MSIYTDNIYNYADYETNVGPKSLKVEHITIALIRKPEKLISIQEKSVGLTSKLSDNHEKLIAPTDKKSANDEKLIALTDK